MRIVKPIVLTLIVFFFSSCKKDKEEVQSSGFEPEVVEIKSKGQKDLETTISHLFAFGKNEFGIGYNEIANSNLIFGVATINATKPASEAYEGRVTIETRGSAEGKTGGLNKIRNGLSQEIAVVNTYNGVGTTISAYKVDGVQYFLVSQRYYHGKVEISKLIEVNDAFFLVGGITDSSGKKDVCVLELTEQLVQGKIRIFGGADNDMATDVVLQADGKVAILGYTHSNGGDRDIWLIKYDLNTKDTLFTKTFGGTAYEEPQALKQDKQGRLYISGHSSSFGSPEHDGYLLCTDASFNKVWEKTYGTKYHDGFNTLALLPNNKGLIAAGRSMQSVGQPEDIFVVATDLQGNEIWRKKYGDATLTELPLDIIADDEFYYLACNRVDAAGKFSAAFIKDKLGN